MSADLVSLRRTLVDVCPQPWKNGLGRTRELGRGEHWRISIADVSGDGDFSLFPGATRHSMTLVRDQRLGLRSGLRQVEIHSAAPTEYDGGMRWSATLRSGPAQVLNVMGARAFVTILIQRKPRHCQSPTQDPP